MPFLYIVLALLLLTVSFLFIPMQFGVHYRKTTTKSKFYIYVSLFGILIRIPIHTIKEPKRDKKKRKKKADKPAAFTWELFRKKVDALAEVARISRLELIEMLTYVREHLTCKELDFRIAFGTGDAAKTGITTGAVWTSGTLLLKLIDSFIGIRKMHMDVYPDFNGTRFEISVKTILIMQPFRFIIIYKKISKTINFIKDKISNLK